MQEFDATTFNEHNRKTNRAGRNGDTS